MKNILMIRRNIVVLSVYSAILLIVLWWLDGLLFALFGTICAIFLGLLLTLKRFEKEENSHD